MAEHRGEKLPDFILNAPELNLATEVYFKAFVDLDTCRPPAFNGAGSIPWLSIVEYGKIMGLTDVELFDFVDVISLVDNMYLKKIHEDEKASK